MHGIPAAEQSLEDSDVQRRTVLLAREEMTENHVGQKESSSLAQAFGLDPGAEPLGLVCLRRTALKDDRDDAFVKHLMLKCSLRTAPSHSSERLRTRELRQ